MRPLLAILVLVATAFVCAWTEARAVESRLSDEVQSAVDQQGLDQVTATVDGRDVLLEGTVPNVERKQAAGHSVAGIEGVRNVANRLTLDIAPPAAGVDTDPAQGIESSSSITACQGAIDEALTAGRIDFESSSAALRESSEGALSALVAALTGCEGGRIEIAGHTDASGPRDENLELSLRRAESVLSYLVAAGVPRERLTAVGYGPDRPLVSNETPDGRAVNRRIEFEVQDTGR